MRLIHVKVGFDDDYRLVVIKDCCADADAELHACLIDRLLHRARPRRQYGGRVFRMLDIVGVSERISTPRQPHHDSKLPRVC